MTEATSDWFESFDGVRLCVHEMGEGRPLVLLHGLFSSAYVNWIKFGTAAQVALAGFRIIMPDLRAHGQSAAPHDPAAYPHDVLVRDIEALITHLGLEDFDLGGFSLGARTTAKLLLRGMNPGRAILSGMGLEGLSGWARRRDFFLDAIAMRDTVGRGDEHWMAVQFMKTMKIDPVAATLLLNTFGDIEPDEVAAIQTETLVLCGRDDRDNGSPVALADLLPNGRLKEIPGTHMSCITTIELGEAIVDFLTA
ncbi:alpha/beta fold hydrolase [Rhizorhapis sp. SPR117]|uniref:alpha/beta fold hydrolase n=1 Tax=Rhizorhapis sp. SPR117 TaxID=2912611 RepID=UPI001F31C2D8|nr:alpha/beta hydrolase [Rhizorhapis sp. SPR117]